MGLTPDMLDQPSSADPVELWPCLLQAWGLFCAMQTQWRTAGTAGRPTGLDYSAIPIVAYAMSLSQRALRRLWPDLQAMERAALKFFTDRTAHRG